jgi:tRNA(Ile)-lysidine synthase
MKPQQIIDKLKLAEKSILVAASAGSDSMVLLDGLYRNGIDVVACYIDHGQRPEETEIEKDLLANYCAERDIAFVIQHIDLAAFGSGENKQAFFRTQRYALLSKQAELLEIATVATGHHQDDQAETQLMRLIKNYDIMSYTGIVPLQQLTAEVKLIRPLLEVRKGDILAYAERFDVPYAQDSTNMSDAYFRNRVRNETMPVFEAENQHFVPEFIEKMTDFVTYQEYLQGQLRQAMVETFPPTNVIDQAAFMAFLKQYEHSLQKLIIPVLLQAFLGYEGKIKQEKVKEIMACLMAYPIKTKVSIDESTSFGVQYGKIFLTKEDGSVGEDISMRLTLGENIIGSYHIICSTEEAIASDPWTTIIVPEEVFATGVYLRLPAKTDYLPLKQGRKKLNRLYIDEKVLPHERFKQLVLATDHGCVIYDVRTGKIGFLPLNDQNEAGISKSIYLHIKKRANR